MQMPLQILRLLPAVLATGLLIPGPARTLAAPPAEAAATVQAQSQTPLKEKPRLAPRPLPGTTADKDKDKEVPVIPFIPPAAVISETAASAEVPPVMMDMERARIVQIRRRGTFTLPQAPPSEAPAPSDEQTVQPSPDLNAPEPLEEGKIRIIPRAAAAEQPRVTPAKP